MPWLVSMRMMGQVIGALAIVSTRMSVILSAEGLELVLTFCGSASSVWSAQNPVPNAPPKPLRNPRRPVWLGVRDFMGGSYHSATGTKEALTHRRDAETQRGTAAGQKRFEWFRSEER